MTGGEKPRKRRSAAHGEAGYARHPLDAYMTRPPGTLALLEHVRLPKRILEPCCGDGRIVGVLRAAGHEVEAFDIADHGFPCEKLDFLTSAYYGAADAIVTNPPYSCADQFIRHALAQMERRMGMVAMLLQHLHDTAAGRMDLFQHPAFALKLTLTFRLDWVDPQPGQKRRSPRFNHSWYVWDFRHRGPAQAIYARRPQVPA